MICETRAAVYSFPLPPRLDGSTRPLPPTPTRHRILFTMNPHVLGPVVQFFDKWTLSQLDAADYEEAPPAPEWVVQDAARREGAARRSEYEQREALETEMPGVIPIKHHVTPVRSLITPLTSAMFLARHQAIVYLLYWVCLSRVTGISCGLA